MKLSEVLKDADILSVNGSRDLEISEIAENSKEANALSVFVIIQGARFDGMDFLNDARKNGCRIFVSERKFEISKDETLILTENARKTSAELSFKLYFSKIKDIYIIGITGTKGKTTTAKILLECLAFANIPSVMIGTLGVKYKGLALNDALTENTTPNATFVYKTLKNAYKNGARAAIIEVSSQALISHRVFGLPFNVCIFTNLSVDHIGEFEHASFEEYTEAKLSLFREYGADIFVINSDDKYASLFIAEGEKRGAKIIRVSKKSNAEFVYSNIRSSLTSLEFFLNGEKFELPIGGEYNALNASLAIAAASSLFGKKSDFFKAPISLSEIEGRYEAYDIKGKKVVIDFAHNEESMKTVCKSIRKLLPKKIILVFGSVGGRSKKRRKSLAKTAEKYADFSYITSDNPGFEDSDKICEEIYSAFTDKSKAIPIPDRETAIRTAINGASAGDFVLLLGKGHEEYQEIGAVKVPFSESDIIISMGALRERIKNL